MPDVRPKLSVVVAALCVAVSGMSGGLWLLCSWARSVQRCMHGPGAWSGHGWAHALPPQAAHGLGDPRRSHIGHYAVGGGTGWLGWWGVQPALHSMLSPRGCSKAVASVIKRCTHAATPVQYVAGTP
jgi:hypothetical protein